MPSFHPFFKEGRIVNVVYPICCGVDVHKTFFVATLIITEGIQPKYQKRRFSTFNNQILAFKAWLLENNCRDVCMESTGKYWIPVFNLLEDSINVTIANPKWVKTVKGNKDDAKDSKWIGDLFRIGLVPGSFIPGKDIRILREFMRYGSSSFPANPARKTAIKTCSPSAMWLLMLSFPTCLAFPPHPSRITL